MFAHIKESKLRPPYFKPMDPVSETVLQDIKDDLIEVDQMLTNTPDRWAAYLSSVRATINTLDRLQNFNGSDRLAEQRWIVQILQDYAYRDADNGGLRDVADWCQRYWLRLLRDHPDDVDILAGLGESWLQRSQASLAKIHQEESSSSGGSSHTDSYISQRLQNPSYVEARGFLQPAVDFLSRAVTAAERNGTLTGDLLAKGAEAYMSLGNVSSTSTAELYFGHAVQYLRRAQTIPGYTLTVYLEEFLESYGRYVN